MPHIHFANNNLELNIKAVHNTGPWKTTPKNLNPKWEIRVRIKFKALPCRRRYRLCEERLYSQTPNTALPLAADCHPTDGIGGSTVEKDERYHIHR